MSKKKEISKLTSCSRSVTKHITAVKNNKLTFNSNSAGLKDVINNACLTLDFSLLAIEENITPNHKTPCLYDPCKVDFSFCSISKTEHAHLYISTNILHQHCIILFANRTRSKTDYINDLVENFYNSIERFKRHNANFPNINHFKPLRFYIYFYGDDPPVVINDYNTYCAGFTRALEKRLGYKTNELDACVSPHMCKRWINHLTIINDDNLLKLKPF